MSNELWATYITGGILGVILWEFCKAVVTIIINIYFDDFYVNERNRK